MAARKAKRRPCPSCGRAFQRGSIVTRLVKGGAVRQVVCQTCAGMAVAVLASDAKAVCQMCHTNLANICLACLSGALDRENNANLLMAMLRKPGRTFKRSSR